MIRHSTAWQFGIIAGLCFLLAIGLFHQSSYARSVDNSCPRVESIFARGSGETPGDATYARFQGQINDKLKGSGINHTFYELGTESYGGYQYKAVKVDNVFYFNAGQALIYNQVSALSASNYGKSVNNGIQELKSYMSQRYEKCKSAGTYYILGGYSQGAQVVGDALKEIPRNIRDRIIFVGLFGDPKLYFPEGKWGPWGVFTPPPACQGKQLSLYRRVIGDCELYAGSLGPRVPYLPSDMEAKTGSWCYANDLICGTSHNLLVNSGHGQYRKAGFAIDSAASEAVARLETILTFNSGSTSSPTPKPEFDLTKITHKFGDGLNGQDVVIMVDAFDIEGQPLGYIDDFLDSALPKITAKGGHLAFVVYAGTRYLDESYTALGGVTFDAPNPGFEGSGLVDFLVNNAHSQYQGSTLDALNSSMNALNWHDGATKSIILFTTNSDISGPGTSQSTMTQLVNKSLAIDPVNVYPVVPETYMDSYKSMADLTSGQVTPYTDDLEQAANAALDKIYNRPAVFLKNTGYAADPGQEITFDASDSYILDGTITKYDWDFDGDGMFDATTTTPIVNHTYTKKFDGMMQVRATGSNDTIANASATVKIGTYVPPVLPQAPTGLQATVLKTEDGISTVRLTWQPNTDSQTKGLALSVNGIILGMMTPDRTSIDITDVDRSTNVDFGIAGVGVDGTNPVIGNATIVTLAKPKPQSLSNTTSTATTTTTRSTSDSDAITATSTTISNGPAVLGLQSQKISASVTGRNIISTHSSKNRATSDLDQYLWVAVLAVGAGIAYRLFVRTRSRR